MHYTFGTNSHVLGTNEICPVQCGSTSFSQPSSIFKDTSRNGLTFDTLRASLAMTDRFHPLPFASTRLSRCAWCFVLFCVTADVLVDDFSARVDKVSVGVKAHLDVDVMEYFVNKMGLPLANLAQ